MDETESYTKLQLQKFYDALNISPESEPITSNWIFVNYSAKRIGLYSVKWAPVVSLYASCAEHSNPRMSL
jgi:hypothetical protein